MRLGIVHLHMIAAHKKVLGVNPFLFDRTDTIGNSGISVLTGSSCFPATAFSIAVLLEPLNYGGFSYAQYLGDCYFAFIFLE